MADISNLIGKLNNSNEEVIDQLNENNEHVSRTNNLIQNLSKVLAGNDLQEAEDKRELNSLLKKLSEGKGDGKSGSSAGKVTSDGGGGGLLSLLGGALLTGLTGPLGVIGSIIKILGAKSPLATAVKMLKGSKIAKTFVSIFKNIKGFFGKEGGAKKLLGRIKKAKPLLKKGLKFLGRVFGRLFAIFTVITAVFDAKKVFDETEGSFSEKLGAALKEFGASVLDAIFGWIPTLAGHVLEFFGAPKWLTDMLKEFDLKAEIKLLVDTLSIMLEDAIMFFMDGSFTKMFTEDIPNSIGEFFGKLRDWFDLNILDPIKNFVDNNEAIQTAIVGFKVLWNAIKAVPTFIENFIFNIVNAVKGVLASIVSWLDGIVIGGKRSIAGKLLSKVGLDLPEFSMGDIIPESIRTFVKAPDLKTKEIDLMEGVDMTKLQNIRARNLGLPETPPVAPVIVPVPAAGPSGTGGGSGPVINVNNGSDSSIRDAQNRALQGPPSIFQFYSIP
jgi:hypothetical protein